MPIVLHAETNMYACSDTSQQHIQDTIKKKRLNRLVVASCSPRTHEILFQETLRESGLNQYLFAMTNIRDQCSWVHRDDPRAATDKAIDLMRMAVARARHLKALGTGRLPVTQSALVLGGGLAGMTAALAIADQGYAVNLIEREDKLGGQLRHLRYTLEGADVEAFSPSWSQGSRHIRKSPSSSRRAFRALPDTSAISRRAERARRGKDDSPRRDYFRDRRQRAHDGTVFVRAEQARNDAARVRGGTRGGITCPNGR